MAKLTPTEVLNWFREVEPEAGRQMLELAEDAITNRIAAAPKAARRTRGPNKPKDGAQGQGAGQAA